MLNSYEEQLARWRFHFSSVLNHNLAENAPPLYVEALRYNNNPWIKKDAPSVAEIRDTIKTLPKKKAAGIDGIPVELYKANLKQSAALLHPLIKDACENESFPSDHLIIETMFEIQSMFAFSFIRRMKKLFLYISNLERSLFELPNNQVDYYVL